MTLEKTGYGLQGVRYLAGGVQSGLSHYDPEKVRTCFKIFKKITSERIGALILKFSLRLW